MYNQLNFVYLLEDNQEQFELFRMSILSLLKFNKVDNIGIMYFNCKLSKLQNFIKDLKLDVHFDYFYFDVSLIDQNFPPINNATNSRLRYPSLSRWWITKLVPYDCFWYVDTDILFNANIKEKFISIQSNKEELFYLFNRKEYLICGDRKSKLFWKHTYDGNCGIMYINSKKYNSLITLEEIFDFYRNNADSIYYMNQTCYFYLFEKYGATIEISELFNKKLTHKIYRFNELKMIKIFHFTGKNKTNMYTTFEYIMNR